MKKTFLALIVALLLLASFVLVRALKLESRQIDVERAEPAPVDAHQVAEELSEALRFRSISYEDRRRIDTAPFLSLHDYIARTYPLINERLELEKVNGYSLLYTWKGSAPQLKPALLMAHLDVVPVEAGTKSQWSHPPYSGAVAEGFVWGRGAMDDKGTLIAILHAVETLLAEGYEPRRTVYLSFGHDEEIGGDEGAAKVAERLAAENIRLSLVVDEGGAIAEGSMLGLDQPVAAVGIAEKGAMNVELTVDTEGGHSSVPPASTAVGILSRAITRLEDHPVPGGLRPPITDMLDYLAPELDLPKRVVFANLWLFRGLVEHLFERNPISRAMIRTTTAATVFHAGDKANVLPSKARAVVNFRILPGDTVETVTAHIQRVIHDDRVQIHVSAPARNPSETSSLESPGWLTLQRSIRALYPDVVVVPYLLVGGSDSRHFTPLTDSVYRFAGVRASNDELRRAHGTDERISLENLEALTRFSLHLIRNAGGGQ